MGSIRFMFAFGTSMLIQTITVSFVAAFGGGAAAWRTVAIIYAVVGLISNTISVMSVRELSPEELAGNEINPVVYDKQIKEGELEQVAEELKGEAQTGEEKYSLGAAFKLLVQNKYYQQDGIYHRKSGTHLGSCRGLYGKCTAHAGQYCHCSVGHESSSRQHECAHCDLLGIHLSDYREEG